MLEDVLTFGDGLKECLYKGRIDRVCALECIDRVCVHVWLSLL